MNTPVLVAVGDWLYTEAGKPAKADVTYQIAERRRVKGGRHRGKIAWCAGQQVLCVEPGDPYSGVLGYSEQLDAAIGSFDLEGPPCKALPD